MRRELKRLGVLGALVVLGLLPACQRRDEWDPVYTDAEKWVIGAMRFRRSGMRAPDDQLQPE